MGPFVSREHVANLQRKYGSQVKFIIAFEDLTKEGYGLMAIDEGKESSFASGILSIIIPDFFV